MESLISSLPFAGYIIAIIVLVMGVAASFYLFDSYRERKKQTAVKAADDLVGILNETVGALKDKVENQEKAIHELTLKVDTLSRDNEILTKVLQGRDAGTQEFYKQGFAAMKLSLETNAIVKEIATAIKSQTKSFNKIIEIFINQSKEKNNA